MAFFGVDSKKSALLLGALLYKDENEKDKKQTKTKVIFIKESEVNKDKEVIESLPDYSGRLKEIEDEKEKINKEMSQIIREMKKQDSYVGDPRVLMKTLPFLNKLDALNNEKSLITVSQYSYEKS